MNIKDYLHLYLGCEVKNRLRKEERFILSGYNKGKQTCFIWNFNKPEEHMEIAWEFIVPVLRPLSDMTEEEAKHFFGLSDNAEVYCKVNHGNHTEFMYKWEDGEVVYDTKDGKSYSSVAITHNRHLLETSSDGFIFLLSKHFDLFGLIDAGLAIDTTQVPDKERFYSPQQ
jgi:hypothetical protein